MRGARRIRGGVAERDPANVLLHRFRVRRLAAESVRDAILAVSGRLDRKLCGPGVPVHLTSFMEGRGRPESGPLDGNGRRSMYLPSGAISCRRCSWRSTCRCRSLRWGGGRAQRAGPVADPDERSVRDGGGGALGGASAGRRGRRGADRRWHLRRRSPAAPAAGELEAAALLGAAAGLYACGADDPRVWTDLCHVLFNTKEFIYIR